MLRRSSKCVENDALLQPESPESGEDFRCPFINTNQYEREKAAGLVKEVWKCERSEKKGRYPVITMDYILVGSLLSREKKPIIDLSKNTVQLALQYFLNF